MVSEDRLFWLPAQIMEFVYMYILLFLFHIKQIKIKFDLKAWKFTHVKTKFSLKHKKPSSIKSNLIKMN